MSSAGGADLPGMEKATSADGTPITFDVEGDGPVVVVVGGAFNDRRTWTVLTVALAAQGMTAVTYDRRGRGDSGDTHPYAVEREFEDLQAVVDAVQPGGPVCAHGVSSGGALLLRAADSGLPVARLSVLEPPYRIEGAPPAPEDYTATLERLLAEGDRSGMVEYFQTRAVGLPVEMVQSFKAMPMWPALEAMAHTLVYDAHAMGGDESPLPVDLLARLQVPVLAVTSEGTAGSWLSGTAEAVAGVVPGGRWVRLPGDFHSVPPEVLAPVLADFYGVTGR